MGEPKLRQAEDVCIMYVLTLRPQSLRLEPGTGPIHALRHVNKCLKKPAQQPEATTGPLSSEGSMTVIVHGYHFHGTDAEGFPMSVDSHIHSPQLLCMLASDGSSLPSSLGIILYGRKLTVPWLCFLHRSNPDFRTILKIYPNSTSTC